MTTTISDEDEEDYRWLSARFVVAVFFFRKEFAFVELTSGRDCVCEFDRKLVQSGENFTRFSTKNLESDRLYYDEAKETLTDGEYDLLRMKFEAVERKFEELRGKFDDGMYAGRER